MISLLNTLGIAASTKSPPNAGPAAGQNDALSAFDRLNGFVAGTCVATSRGWCAVEALGAGDFAITFDSGPREIVAITRGTYFASSDTLPEFACPISVPAGAIGNDEPLILLPDQTVMLESDVAEDLTGDPFAMFLARDLVGFRGIERTLGLRPIDIVTLHFEADEIVAAEGGALVMAPAAVPGDMNIDFMTDAPMPAPYTNFKGEKARMLIDAMAQEDARAFGSAAYAAAA